VIWFRLNGASFASVRSYLYHAVATKVIVELDIDRFRGGRCRDVLCVCRRDEGRKVRKRSMSSQRRRVASGYGSKFEGSRALEPAVVKRRCVTQPRDRRGMQA
jgi:hypothetical protein